MRSWLRVGVLVLGVLGAPAARAEIAAPVIVAADLDGVPVEWTSVLAHGPVLVSFWATWCKPCAAELPALQRVVAAVNADSSASPRLTWLAINEDGPRNRSKIRPAAHRAGMTARIVPDEDGSLAASFQVVSFPTTVLLDARGRIVSVHQGYRAGDEIALAAEIATVLAVPADSLR